MNLLGLGLSQSRFSPRKYRPSLWLDASRGVYQDAAVQFTAADKSWLQIADAAQTGLDPGTDDFLICGWVWCDLLSQTATLIYKGAGAGTPGYPGYLLQVATNGSVYCAISDGSASRVEAQSAAGVITTGAWAFLAVIADRDGNMTVYKNDVAVKAVSIAAQAGNVNSTNAFCVGSLAGIAGYFFDGRLDSLMIFKKPDLSPHAADIIAWAYNSGAGRLCSEITAAQKTAWGAVSGWEMAELSGQRKDSWGSNHLDEQFGELVTNGTFTGNSTGWTEGAGWAYGTNNEAATAATGDLAQSTVAATAGKRYATSFKAAVTSGSVRLTLGGVNGTTREATGTHAQTITATSTASLAINPVAAFTGTIDDVSIKAAEILRAPGIARSIAANGDGVSYWRDSSNNSKHASIITLAKRPTLVTSGINSRPVVRGDGVDDYLGVPTISLTGGFAISAVFACSANPSNLTLLGKDANNYIALTDNTTVTVRIGGGTATAFTVGAIGTDAHILTVTRDAANAVRVYLDGTESTTGAKTIAGTLALEQIMANAGGYFAGDVADVLVYDGAKSAAELARITTYLSRRYGVTI